MIEKYSKSANNHIDLDPILREYSENSVKLFNWTNKQTSEKNHCVSNHDTL